MPATLASPAATACSDDIVFTFSYATWDGAQQRGGNFAQDRMAIALLDSPQVRRVLVANPYRSAPRRVARSLLRRDAPFPGGPRSALHSPLRMRRRDPTAPRAIARAYERYDRLLERAAADAGLDRPAVLTMHPLVAGFAPLRWARRVTFYASDDWAAAPAYRPWWPAFEEAYARIVERGMPVVGVSRAIVDRLAPAGDGLVVPNGVQPAEWERFGVAPAWFARLDRPRLLYVGTLDDRVDVELVQRVAADLPGASLTFAGPVTSPETVAALAALPQVHIQPRVPRREVPSLMYAADACLIPHRRTRFTRAMSPLKAYEYLAAGRPVAAVDLPPLHGIDGRLELATDAEGFVTAVRRALAAGPATEDERIAFVHANAWSARHGSIIAFALHGGGE